MPRKLTSQKRADLLGAAIKVFKNKGYRNASVKDVVAEAGASTATFYRYFKTKDDLYEEIVMGFLSGFVSVWSGAYNSILSAGDDEGEAVEAVTEAFRSVLDYYRYNRDVAQIVFRSILPVDERFAERADMVVNTTIDQIEDVVGRLEAGGLVKNIEPRVGAAVTIGGVFGLAVDCILQGKRDDIDNLARQIVTIMMSGITGET